MAVAQGTLYLYPAGWRARYGDEVRALLEDSGKYTGEVTNSPIWTVRGRPVRRALPISVTSAYTPPNGYFPVSPWGGLAVLAAYTAVALLTALWLLRRRDA
jgi:hypothetical protein